MLRKVVIFNSWRSRDESPEDTAYAEGWHAGAKGERKNVNPYAATPYAAKWAKGYQDGDMKSRMRRQQSKGELRNKRFVKDANLNRPATIVKSPKRELEEYFASLRPSIAGSFPQIKRKNSANIEFNLQDRVFDKADPRHVGKITAIKNSAYADIKWDNGWKSTNVPLRDLRKAGTGDVLDFKSERGFQAKVFSSSGSVVTQSPPYISEKQANDWLKSRVEKAIKQGFRVTGKVFPGFFDPYQLAG